MDINYELLQCYADKKIIKRKQIKPIYDECLRLGISIERYMTEREYCTETEALPVLGAFYGLPYAEVDMLEIDRSLLEKFGYSLMKRHKFIPVSIDRERGVRVAIGDPFDLYAKSAITAEFICEASYILVPPSQIDRYIDSIVTVLSTTKALGDLTRDENSSDGQRYEKTIEQVDDVINNPSVRLVDSIIREAIPLRASDIHIEPFDRTVKVRYRIDGDLQLRAEFPIQSYSAVCARLKILSGINIAERRIPQDGRIGLNVNGTDYDFRVSTLPTVYGEKFVIRILDKTSFHFTRAELGFLPEENAVIDKILAHSYGIVLLTGPTGCGKSTTLYSFLKEINNPTVNVVTVEDPVEYMMDGINQVQVNPKINLTFASALRSILRQDPDVIMIGEIRDEDTAEIAVRAAITGHLVLSTLHTNDAPGAITRLEDMKIDGYLVADALVGVIAQRLVKRLCPVCKKRGKTNELETNLLGLSEPVFVCRPQGCRFCSDTGYKGRVAVHEIMYVSERLKRGIAEGKSLEQLREICASEGMIRLWDNCKKLVLKGITDISELMELYDDRQDHV